MSDEPARAQAGEVPPDHANAIAAASPAETPGAQASAGGVTVAIDDAELRALATGALSTLVQDGVPRAIAAKDSAVWGPDAQAEAAVRLGWLDCTTVSRGLLPRLATLRAELAGEGVDHVVLAGMGGSSLAPEVISRTAGVALTVLDTTDPHQVRRALEDRLDRTAVVVASKSGSTLETDSHRRAYEQAFRDAGIDPARRVVAVTDPGSGLARAAQEAGYRLVEADPSVGGRYSALTAFGLTPTALAGVDVGQLLDEAAALLPSLGAGGDDPATLLGAALGGAAVAGRDKAVLADAGSGIPGFGDWAEQLIAESTGKRGTGILPVVVGSPSSPGVPGDDRVVVGLGGPGGGLRVEGPLGAQFLLWEFATAVAGRVLGIDPFDQPNVQESKDNTAALLRDAGDGPLPGGEPALVEGPVEVHADPALVAGDLAGTLARLLEAVPARGYLAVMAYLDRQGDAAAAELRDALARRTPGAVTFGWGPRFLHSTGQFHKGGPAVGAYLQVSGAVTDDLAVPGRDGLTFGRLQLAQVLGDERALRGRGRPVVRLHLRDRAEGLAALLEAARR